MNKWLSGEECQLLFAEDLSFRDSQLIVVPAPELHVLVWLLSTCTHAYMCTHNTQMDAHVLHMYKVNF